MFGKLCGRKPAASPATPPKQTQAQREPEPTPFPLPEGQIFWEIRPTVGNNVKVGHGIGYYLVLGRDWDELGKQRRAAATAAAPKFVDLWGSATFPAYEYRYKPEHFPKP